MLEVINGINASINNVGLAPLVSVTNTLTTFNTEAPTAAASFVNTIEATKLPLAPAVKAVTSAPEPSLAVFAAVI